MILKTKHINSLKENLYAGRKTFLKKYQLTHLELQILKSFNIEPKNTIRSSGLIKLTNTNNSIIPLYETHKKIENGIKNSTIKEESLSTYIALKNKNFTTYQQQKLEENLFFENITAQIMGYEFLFNLESLITFTARTSPLLGEYAIYRWMQENAIE